MFSKLKNLVLVLCLSYLTLLYANDVEPNDPYFAQQWGTKNIKLPSAWESTVGSNTVYIGIIDSGLDTSHIDLTNNIWLNQAEFRGDVTQDDDKNGYKNDYFGINTKNDNTNMSDKTGHGTQVAGIIGAEGNNSIGISGVNWNVKLVNCSIGEKPYKSEDIVECINYISGLKTKNNWNLPVINLSFDLVGYDAGVESAIRKAGTNNILFVTQAGDNNINTDVTPKYPGSYNLDNIINVGSSTSGDSLAKNSNYGEEKVDLLAPGELIYTTTLNNEFIEVSGTSYAAAHVTGAIGLLAAQYPSETIQERKSRILNGVDITPSTMDKTVTGGRLDVNASLNIDPDYFSYIKLKENQDKTITLSWQPTDESEPAYIDSGYTLKKIDLKDGSTTLDNLRYGKQYELKIKKRFSASNDVSTSPSYIPYSLFRGDERPPEVIFGTATTKGIGFQTWADTRNVTPNYDILKYVLGATVAPAPIEQRNAGWVSTARGVPDVQLFLNDELVDDMECFKTSKGCPDIWIYKIRTTNERYSINWLLNTIIDDTTGEYSDNNRLKAEDYLQDFEDHNEWVVRDSIPAEDILSALHFTYNERSNSYELSSSGTSETQFVVNPNFKRKTNEFKTTTNPAFEFVLDFTKPIPYTSKYISKQRATLINLYNVTGGNSWTNQNGWDTQTTDECQWYGVKCNNGMVTALYLGGNNLIGTIPDLSSLSELKELALQNNKLSGIIDTKIGKLSSLIKLDLSNNELSGNIPNDIGSLGNVSSLKLSNNKLTGNIPNNINNMKELVILDLSQNNLNGEIPPLSNLKKLFDLDLSKNQLTGNINNLTSLSALAQVNLSYNNISDQLPNTISNMLGLVSLNIANNKLHSALPSNLSKLRNLAVLDLSNNNINDTLSTDLGNINTLRVLNLSNNEITGKLPPSIGSLGILYDLDLSNNKLENLIPTELAALTKIRKLSLQNNNLVGYLPEELKSLESLNYLNMDYNHLEASSSMDNWLDTYYHEKVPSGSKIFRDRQTVGESDFRVLSVDQTLNRFTFNQDDFEESIERPMIDGETIIVLNETNGDIAEVQLGVSSTTRLGGVNPIENGQYNGNNFQIWQRGDILKLIAVYNEGTKDFGNGYITSAGIDFSEFNNSTSKVLEINATMNGASVGGDYNATVDVLGDNKFIAYFKGGPYIKAVWFEISDGKIKTTKAGYKRGEFSKKLADYTPIPVATSSSLDGYGIHDVQIKYKSVVLIPQEKTKDFDTQFITSAGIDFSEFNNSTREVLEVNATMNGASVGGDYNTIIDALGDNKFIAYFKGGPYIKAVWFEVSDGKIRTTKAGYKTGEYTRDASQYSNQRIATSKNAGGYGIYKVQVKYKYIIPIRDTIVRQFGDDFILPSGIDFKEFNRYTDKVEAVIVKMGGRSILNGIASKYANTHLLPNDKFASYITDNTYTKVVWWKIEGDKVKVIKAGYKTGVYIEDENQYTAQNVATSLSAVGYGIQNLIIYYKKDVKDPTPDIPQNFNITKNSNNFTLTWDPNAFLTTGYKVYQASDLGDVNYSTTLSSLEIPYKYQTKDFGNGYITSSGIDFSEFNNSTSEVLEINATMNGAYVSRDYNATIDVLGDNKFIAYVKDVSYIKAVWFEISDGKIKTTKAGYKRGGYTSDQDQYSNQRIATSNNAAGYGIHSVTVVFSLDKGLERNVKYTFKVSAFNEYTESAPSDIKEATTPKSDGDICFYWGGSYTGKQTCYSGVQNIPNLGEDNDNWSSLQVQDGWVVTVYENANYQGNSKAYTKGNYSSLGNFNDKISSVKIDMVSPKNLSATLSDNEITATWNNNGSLGNVELAINYQGSSEWITTNIDLAAETTQYKFKLPRADTDIYIKARLKIGDDYSAYSNEVKVKQSTPSGWLACFYENENYNGIQACYTSVQDLGGLGTYNDNWSSLKVQSGYTVEVYENANYQGNSKVYTKGNYSSLGNFNDKISSVKIDMVSPKNLSATLSDNEITATWDNNGSLGNVELAINYQGSSEWITKNIDLAAETTQYKFKLSRADTDIYIKARLKIGDDYSAYSNEVKVKQSTPSGWLACFYENENYNGIQACYTSVQDLGGLGTYNDNWSSLKVQSEYTVEVYENANYQGNSKVYTKGNYSSLGNFNDKISSVKIKEALPSAPTNLRASRNGTSATVNWTNNGEDRTYTQVNIEWYNGSNWTQNNFYTDGANTSYKFTIPKANTKVFVKVRATNSAGESGWSNETWVYYTSQESYYMGNNVYVPWKSNKKRIYPALFNQGTTINKVNAYLTGAGIVNKKYMDGRFIRKSYDSSSNTDQWDYVFRVVDGFGINYNKILDLRIERNRGSGAIYIYFTRVYHSLVTSAGITTETPVAGSDSAVGYGLKNFTLTYTPQAP